MGYKQQGWDKKLVSMVPTGRLNDKRDSWLIIVLPSTTKISRQFFFCLNTIMKFRFSLEAKVTSKQ